MKTLQDILVDAKTLVSDLEALVAAPVEVAAVAEETAAPEETPAA